jgi:hypothetical protein
LGGKHHEKILSDCYWALATCASAAFAEQPYAITGSIPFNSGASQLVYSEAYHTLAIRNSGSAITLIDLNSGSQKSMHFSNSTFTDMDLSPDGRYLFAADYGNENIGYGTPLNTSYVHRYDLMDGTWTVNSTKNIAGSIEAVSSDRVVLASKDQWITFSYEAVTPGASTTVLRDSYYATVYSGDIEYDAAHSRLLHGNSGLSSAEIAAFKIVNNDFQPQESSGTYGSADGYGGSVALANDDSAFYYGRLQVDPLDVTHNRNVFEEIIHGATHQTAFGETKYFDAQTGTALGSYGFNTSILAVNPHGNDFWAMDSANHRLVHMAPVPEPSEYALMLAGLGLLGLLIRARTTELG